MSKIHHQISSLWYLYDDILIFFPRILFQMFTYWIVSFKRRALVVTHKGPSSGRLAGSKNMEWAETVVGLCKCLSSKVTVR